MEVTGHTRVFGIIGDPVSHSLSPLFQGYFARKAGVDALYAPFHVARGKLPQAVSGLHALGAEGFNITVPFKEEVLELVSADAVGRRIGAVNTAKRHADTWLATNTDWQGMKVVMDGLGSSIITALVFGAGGTARAILHALAEAGVQHVRVCNRGRPRLESLLRHAKANYPELHLTHVHWTEGDVRRAAEESQLLVNTTSIGLSRDTSAFPFRLAGPGVAIDAVYRPDGRTPFVEAAHRAGLKAVDGLPLLLAQGAASFYYWHGVSPDYLSALRWLEDRLGREHLSMPGW